jgi:phage shock protein C
VDKWERRYYKGIMEPKRLYRSTTNKVFAGVCGGLGEYLNIDPVLIRLLWLLIVIATGIFPGVVVYIIAIFVIPKKA